MKKANVGELLQQGVALHQAGRLDEAKARYQRALAVVPNQVDALHLLGLIAKQQGNVRQAIEQIGRAARLQPAAAAIQCNLGAALQDDVQYDRAEACFLRAVELKSDYAMAWHNLGNVRRMRENWGGAIEAYQRVLSITPDHTLSRLQLGAALQGAGRLPEAITELRAALQQNGADASALRYLGVALARSGEFSEAEQTLRRSLEAEPRHAESLCELGIVLHETGRYAAAADAYRQALAVDPDAAGASTNLGVVLDMLGDPAGALAALEQALAVDPNNADALGNWASALERSNRDEEALVAAKKGLQIDPTNVVCGVVWAKCLRREKRYDEAIAILEAVDRTACKRRIQKVIAFEAGALFDRVEQPRRAFDEFTLANRLTAVDRDEARSVRETLLREINAATILVRQIERQPWSPPLAVDASDEPTFLVGFPRSGTTLLEVALDAHPQVQSLSEEPTVLAVERFVRDLDGGYPDALPTMTAEQLAEARRRYFEVVDSRVQRRDGAVLVDKMPMNSMYAALIRRVFPQARFLLALRHPADACLSCFMQDFAVNRAMIHFLEMKSTVALYVQTMTHWLATAAALDATFHTVKYEALVDDYAGTMRATIDFLGLPWDDAVLEHRQSAARRDKIRTPSYHQVAEPIYRRARLRYVRYREQLAEVLPTLAPLAAEFDYGEI